MTQICLTNVTKRFKGADGKSFDALSKLTFTSNAESRLIALVGPDGAGKSTLMRMLCGLLMPDNGSVRVLGQIPDADNPEFLKWISFMPQRFGLYQDISCIDNLRLFGRLKGVRDDELREKSARLLEMTGLGSFENRLAGKLSGGMKQKLGLACALVADPKILILDEPTVGVDPLSRQELWDVIALMQKRNGTLALISTAYLEEAQKADEVIFLEEGKLIYAGSPQKMIACAENRTWALTATANNRKASRILMNSVSGVLEHSPILDAVPRSGKIDILTINECIDPKEWLKQHLKNIPFELAKRPATLEDAYAAMTMPNNQREINQSSAEIEVCDDLSLSETQNASKAVIRAEGVSRYFGNFVAVADTTFSVKKGEIFGLLGPNGAGKTTTFRMLCALLTPSSGLVRVLGEDLMTAKSSVRARIGYVAQKFSLYEKLTVFQNLRFFAQSYGLHGQLLKDRIEESFRVFHLGQYAQTRAVMLPFGARQELAMACALIHKPEILFLDEATSGADLAARRLFWRRIVNLAAAGTTVVVTTHFMEEAEYCDRFLIQDAGRILVLGTPAQIKQRANDKQQKEPAASVEEAFVRIVRGSRGLKDEN